MEWGFEPGFLDSQPPLCLIAPVFGNRLWMKYGSPSFEGVSAYRRIWAGDLYFLQEPGLSLQGNLVLDQAKTQFPPYPMEKPPLLWVKGNNSGRKGL